MAARISCWWLQPWQKLDLEWQEGCNRGQQQLAKASDSVQKTTYLTGDHWGSLAECGQLKCRATSRLWELAHRCCNRLQSEVDKLAEIYVRMRRLLLDDVANTLGGKQLMLLEVLAMYEHELVAKSLIASDIFECARHETMTVYLASWQMQPHIDRQRIEELVMLIQNDQHYRTRQSPK
uniref:Uncharacterized protein n=1 Tax=Hyaloperonospora arabidopsidis (strain Emoy2) TaxID=559515 RepID=M4C4Y9_HYAAE